NGNETGHDCGGPDCPPCPTGEGCKNGSDCISGVCNGTKLCAAPTCNDTVQNGNETGHDCGGPDCPPCPTGEGCKNGSDCISGVCNGTKLCAG
ncbi:unnamed protein product, partial [Rotaria sp. Silwood1]